MGIVLVRNNDSQYTRGAFFIQLKLLHYRNGFYYEDDKYTKRVREGDPDFSTEFEDLRVLYGISKDGKFDADPFN